MEQLPVCLNLKDRKVVVTGGGTVAARKAELALRAGARVLVVADALSDEFVDLARQPRFTHRKGALEPRDLDGAVIAYAASENHAEEAEARRLACEAGVLLNVPDRPELCDFSMPSILDRSPLLVAISSAGASPLLGRLIKERLEALIPATYGNLTRFLGSIREGLQNRIPDNRKRRRFLETIVDSPVADLVLAGDEPRARHKLDAAVDAFLADGSVAMGEVYLVGGGPGDPDLLTFRALRLMQRADVVVYDRLIGSPILELVRRDAERIYVGKQRNEHTMQQEDISRLLVSLAKQGKRVLRLKGGDPFIFGRGGEEIEELADHGVPFQIVPGVTAAAGCASFAGIPLTHRDHAQACVFVTGHTKTGRLSLDFSALLQPQQTVVIYMGLAYLGDLMRDFLDHGADPAMPVAVVENGTRPNQKVVTGSIADIAIKVASEQVKGPALTIIGTVVTLRDKLAWFAPAAGNAASATARFAEVGGSDRAAAATISN